MNERNYIKTINASGILPNQLFPERIDLEPGLNIIAGSNGVGKTILLKFIQQARTSQNVIFGEPTGQKNVAAFSPKRNATKVLVEQAQQAVRQDVNAKNNAISQFLNRELQDDTFQTIKSISEYLVLSFEENRDTKDVTSSEAANRVEDEYTDILGRIFDYKLQFTWDSAERKHHLSIMKNGIALQPNQLSSGENALISLIFALFYSRDSAQVYLIDEPEIHLNWQLEEQLFKFLKWFAEKFGRQLIVVTHSRACFIKPFLDATTFLVWNNDKIKTVSRPTNEIKTALAGDMVSIVNGLTAAQKLVYCEDKSHCVVLAAIRDVMGRQLDIPDCLGSRDKVCLFSKGMKQLDVENVFFIIDSDNRKELRPEMYRNLIQLDKYCIENYFLDETVLSQIDKRSDKSKSIETLITQSIMQVKNPNFAIAKELIGASVPLTATAIDTLDASEFLKYLVRELGFGGSMEDFFRAYVQMSHSSGMLATHFEVLDPIFEWERESVPEADRALTAAH